MITQFQYGIYYTQNQMQTKHLLLLFSLTVVDSILYIESNLIGADKIINTIT